MAKDQGRRRRPGKRAPPPKPDVEPEYRKEDVFEAEDADPEEDRQAGQRYDLVDSYEYELPANFEDEEIDEDEAFNSEDERMYGHLFQDRGGDGGSDSDDSEEDEEEEEGEEADLLYSDEEEEEEESEEGGSDLDDVFTDARTTAGSSSSDDDDEQAPSGGSSEDDDDGAHAAMLQAVAGGGPRARVRKQREVVFTEAYPESEFHMPTADGELTLTDLIAGLGDSKSKLGAARKTLERMERRGVPVAAPLPGPIRARQERKAGYEAATKDIAKWVPMVKSNREAPTLRFTSDKAAVPRTATTAALAAKHEPETAMEAEVAALLEAAGAGSARAVAEAEEALAAKSLTVEEVEERRNRLAKMRALLFYHEVKARRLKKIKSKDHRRRLKRAEKRRGAAAADADADGAEVFDQDALRQEREAAEFERAKERLTLKHKNMSRFVRRALKRGANVMDDGTKDAIEEQLRLGQELRNRVHRMSGAGGSDSDSDGSDSDDTSASDSGDDGGGQAGRGMSSKTRAAALELLEGRGTGQEEGAAPATGLFSLPFMQRAMEKKRRQAQDAARAMLDDGEDGEDDAAAGGKAGRRSFGGTVEAEEHAQRVRKLEAAALNSDSELDSDADEDAEAKAARLGRRLRGEDEPEPAAAPAGNSIGSAGNGNGSAAPGRPGVVSTNGPVGVDLAHLQHRSSRHQNGAQQASGRGAGGGSSAPNNSVLEQVSRHKGRVSAQDQLFSPPASAAPGGSGRQPASGQVAATIGSAGSKRAAPGEESPALFLPSKKFQGAKPGYAFQKGPAGVGYYADAAVASASKGLTAPREKKARPAAAALDGDAADHFMRPNGGAEPLTQEQLVRRAFAGDDVAAEFAAEKAADVEEELPKEEVPGALPGWGTWASQKREPRWAAEARAKAAARRASVAASRQDAKLQYVVISEKWDKRNAKYRTPSLPFPYDSKETYERAMRQPLGREFNTDAAFRDLTRPAVIKDAGVIIEPIRYSKAMAEHDAKAEKGAKRAAVVTVAGGMQKRSKKRA